MYSLNNDLFHIDGVDTQILRLLQTDASISNQALAEAVHVSAPTCLRRVKRLHELGLIERQVVILHPDRLKSLGGAGLTAIVELTLTEQSEETLAALQARMLPEPAVQQCYRVSPGPDFILIVQVQDMAAYLELAGRLFTQDARVRNVKAFFSIQRAKFSTALAWI